MTDIEGASQQLDDEVGEPEACRNFERTKDASLQTLEQLAEANLNEQRAEQEASIREQEARDYRAEHAKLKASADRLREKAEAEAFGARFHRNLLAAMKSGSTNVVDMLDAAMRAAGVGTTRPSPPQEQIGPDGMCGTGDGAGGWCTRPVGHHGIHHWTNAFMERARTEDKLSGLNSVVRGNPDARRESLGVLLERQRQIVEQAQRLGQYQMRTPGPEKIAEPAPPAVDLKLGGAAQALVEHERARIRVAALEEVEGISKSMASRNLAASDTADSSDLKVTYRTRAAAFQEMALECRTLKSKPAPHPEDVGAGIPATHDFGWALQQLLAGRTIRQTSESRTWRMRDDGALRDQEGVVLFDIPMTWVLARNWKLAE